MPVLKVKENGKWIDIGSNTDTLDGKHADEFASASDVEELQTLVDNTVKITEQTLTDEQKAQARENIGAASVDDIDVAIEPTEDDIPKVFFGGTLPQTKDEVIMSFRYISKTEDISGYCKIKAQGNSSMRYPKKNQTVKLYKDAGCTEKLKVEFKGWGNQSKFCFKANWIDLTHSRNIVSARLWSDTVQSRVDYDQLPELLKTSPNHGAIDGFPIKVYANGVYQGRYTLNIPKDAWMFNMDDSLDNHCVLCGENYISGCFRATANINESDWTDEIHDTVPVSIKNRWNEVINFVMNSTDDEFRANLGSYFYIDSLIDYHLFGLISCGLDAYGKNQLYVTYDGQKWIASMYDMDSTWGLYYNGSKFVPASYKRNEYEDLIDGRQGNLLYIRLEELFVSEIQTRWTELKNNALSDINIINKFERFIDITPSELVKEDYASTTNGGAFTGIPSTTENNIQQIRSFILARHSWVDEYVDNLTHIPCGGLFLDNTSLMFTGEGTQIINATVSPSDTTDSIIWISSNPSVASIVVDGNVCTVQSRGNGNANIIVTCGDYSATCVVQVSGIIEPGLIYSLPGQTTFDGTNYIDTGVQLFNEDKPFTILFDWTNTYRTNFTNTNLAVLHCMHETSPYNGLAIQYKASTGLFLNVIQNGKTNIATDAAEVSGESNYKDIDNIRGSITKLENGAIQYSIMVNNSGRTYTTFDKYVTYSKITQSLLIGCYQDVNGNKGRHVHGVMNDLKVYDYALTADELDRFLFGDVITTNILADVDHHENSTYNEAGSLVYSNTYNVTDILQLNTGLYHLSTLDRCPSLIVWDDDGNYVSTLQINFTSGAFCLRDDYRYAIQYATTNGFSDSNTVRLNLIDNSATKGNKISIPLDELSYTVNGRGYVEADITEYLSEFGAISGKTLIDKIHHSNMICHLWSNPTEVVHNDNSEEFICVLCIYNGHYILIIPRFSTVEALNNYLINNEKTLIING